MIKRISFLVCLVLACSCKKNVKNETEVYTNNFDSNNLSQISNGVISQYNGSKVLGNYNNSGFTLNLSSLPKHDLVQVSFDLYIHDKWDGDKLSPDGPDIWQMLVDNNMYINTTFSNIPCNSGGFCPPQSYPNNYPNNYNNPKTGAAQINLPGFCSSINGPEGTTLYKIQKTFRHSGNTLKLECLDKLVQPNAPDPKCDESWSVDNINIKAITL